jgi:glycosyltransferase involved in cell wall biosynthesis
MALYAKYVNELHIIVLTLRSHRFSETVHEGNLHLYPTASRNRLFMLIDAFRTAYRVLKSSTEPTTITAQDPLELGLLSLILSRVTSTPFSVQVHGDYYSPYWAMGSFARRARRRLIPSVLARADKVRVVSARVRDSLVARGIRKKNDMTILPIRPELESFLKATRTRSKEDVFTVLTASRLAPEKNTPLLIRAFAKLHAVHPDAHLRIVGEGSERARIESTIKEHCLSNYVTIVPWTNDISTEMANADVFALASLHESYGLVLLESLAAGVPVVTTDVGCVGEVVKNGEHGLVVPVGETESFADALVRMYEDEDFRTQAAMRSRAVGVAYSQHSEDEYAKKWVAAHSA